ncbi:MAG: glycosyltransferase family 2 protein [Selenomonadaceae bacterium]|nr:glycosyltransferase family 2 protein [Selenomonadaceae bacterium]
MKVSVIIPLYNAQNYIGACLESILIQTLQDFEVIVVDDCSTDNSAAIAENYLEKFGGRLKIVYLPKNTGNPSIPRNEGLKFSRGEFIFFMDNDDLLVDNALEILCNFAEKYRADVVCMENGFVLENNSLKAAVFNKNNPNINEILLETENIAERVDKFLKTGYSWAPWTKFIRRDFLIANKIDFPHVKISEDVLWSLKIVCLAKNFLRVPNRLYICRSLSDSWSRIARKPADEVKFWLNPLVKGFDYLNDFLEGDFFCKNPNYRFEVTNFFVKMQVAGMLDALKNLKPSELYEIVHEVFADGKNAALIANLFVFMNFYREKCSEVR